MRLVGSLPNEEQAKRFSLVLAKEKIQHTIEMQMDSLHENFSYAVWVHDEDNLEKAKEYFQNFCSNPGDFVAIEEVIPGNSLEEPKEKTKFKTSWLTIFFLLTCVFVFLVNAFQMKDILQKEKLKKPDFYTPIQLKMFIDEPESFLAYNQIVFTYHFDRELPLSKQSKQVEDALIQWVQIPSWNGIYGILLEKIKYPEKTAHFDVPILEKIQKGEVWRLVTPAFLHANIFHILFNMLWLWFLGKAIERRLPFFNYLSLVIWIAIGSNLTQYFITGPNFMGFSGVIFGFFGYIWVRQKNAPWEGFFLSKTMVMFLVFYVVALVLLSLFAFFIELYEFPIQLINVGNAGHISGALIGMLLGKYPFLIFRRGP